MKKLTVTMLVVLCTLTACAANGGYSDQGGSYSEQRSYGSSYGGATWYREEVPYYATYPNYYDRNRNGVADSREIDRNRNGIPDQREQDRNHNGIPDNKEIDRNKDGKPDRIHSNSDRKGVSDLERYRTPDNNKGYGDRNGNVYGK